MDYAAMAWRRRWIIASPMVVCLFGALIVSAIQVDRYQSDTLIQIVPQRVPDSYVQSTVTLKTDERIESLRQQILSRTQLEQLIREFDLYAARRARLPLQDVVEKMRDDIELALDTQGREVESFHVRFTYTDPDMAAKVTARLGALFADFNTRDRSSLAAATDQFLQTQLSEARARLEAQEQKLEAFRRRNAGRLPTQLDFNMQAIQNTQVQLQALVESMARDRDRKLILEQLLADAQAEPAPVTQVAPTGPDTTGTDPRMLAPNATPAQQLALARETLARLKTRLTPEHPDVIRLTKAVEDLQKRVDADAPVDPAAPASASAPALTPAEEARRQRLSSMRAEIESLDRQIAFKEGEEQKLRQKVADYQTRIEAVPGLESEWLTLSRDYDTQQQAYRAMLMKSESAKVASDLENRQIGEQFRVLDPARVPVRPIGPKRIRINGIGAALGLALGLGLAALLEIRDTSFQTQADVLDVLALPVLALIPAVETADDRQRHRRRRLVLSTVVVLLAVAGAGIFWWMELWKHVI